MTEPALQLEGLAYSYPGRGEPSLRGIDLRVEPGELIVLAGGSGSGKTTLLRAGCGLVPHFHGGEVAGRVTVSGLDARRHGPGELARGVGYVAQDPETQVVSATVRAELELPLELRGEPPAARARAVEEVALALAIPELLGRTTDTLSGGELQRVALAAALVGRPPLVLLDEPTSQLDPVAGDELIGLLRRLNEEWGTAIVLCEHRLERCLAVADRAIALERGRVGFDGGPVDFLAWALDRHAALATPGGRLCAAAGIRPPALGVKEARAELRRRDLVLSGTRSAYSGIGSPAASSRAADLGGGAPAPGRTLDGEPTDPGGRADLERTGAASRSGAGTPSTVLECRDLWVELPGESGPREALRGVDATVVAGERVALMGRNGAGKSTLLRAVAGLVDPVRGSARAPGGIALLTQSPADFLVHERLADELPGEAGRTALEAVGLEWAAGADPRDLSGGERQRAALAVAMAGRGHGGEPPGLVCLDEPTRGMDRDRKVELAGWATGLARRGSAVVIATHDVELAAELADRVLLLGAGELIADGPAAEVLSGGWYFATEVARILGVPGAVTAEQGARLLTDAVRAREVGIDRGGAGGDTDSGRTRGAVR